MKVTKELIDQVKRIDFIQFLEREKGYSFTKIGNYYKCVEHSSLYLNYGKDNIMYYSWYSCSQEGDVIQFVINNICGNFKQAVAFLANTEGIQTQHSPERKNSKSTCKAPNADKENPIIDIKIQYNDNMNRAFAYLCKTRGISYQTIVTFVKANLISEDIRHNLVFKHFDFKGQLVGGELKGTNTYQSFRNIIKGSDEQFGFSYKIGDKVQSIYIFEATVDLMSYYQIYKRSFQNCLLLSTSGVNKINKINNYIDMYKPTTLIVCIDNDTAGNKAFSILQETYKLLNIIDGRDQLKENKIKDFNELLLLNT